MKNGRSLPERSIELVWRKSQIGFSNIAVEDFKILQRRTRFFRDLQSRLTRGCFKRRLRQENESRAFSRQASNQTRRQKTRKAGNKDCFFKPHNRQSNKASSQKMLLQYNPTDFDAKQFKRSPHEKEISTRTQPWRVRFSSRSCL